MNKWMLAVVVTLGLAPREARAQADTVSRVPWPVSRLDSVDVQRSLRDPLLSLNGRVPGASVIPDPTRVGAMAEVVLRLHALARPQSPLFVIDGVVAENGALFLSPGDIERIEVLRGVAASAPYGSRAGAGVIRISTRAPRRSRRWSFGVRTEAGSYDIEREFRPARNTMLLMDERNLRFCVDAPAAGLCGQSIDWATEAARINNFPADTAATPAPLQLSPFNLPSAALANLYQSRPWPGPVRSPVEQALQSGALNLTELTASGSLGSLDMVAGASRLSDPAAFRFIDGFERLAGRLNLAGSFGPRLRASWNTFAARATDNGRSTYGSTLFGSTSEPAIANLLARDTLGRLYRRTNLYHNQFVLNPVAQLEANRDEATLSRVHSSLNARFGLSEWIDLDGNVALDRVSLDRRQGPYGLPVFRAERDATAQALVWSLGATARWRPARAVATEASLRWHSEDRDEDSRWSDSFGAGSSVTRVAQTLTQRSLIARAQVGYRERYLLDALIRRDKLGALLGDTALTSSRVALAWRASTEPWWFAPRSLNLLTVHVARATAGGFVNERHLYNLDNPPGASFVPGPGGRATETELGAELELFHRITVETRYAWSTTNAWVPFAPPALPPSLVNAGTLAGKTAELVLQVPVLNHEGASWSWRLGWARDRAAFDRMTVPPFRYGSNSMFLARDGEPLGAIYGRSFVTSCAALPAGFQPQCGDGRAFQANDDGLIVWVGADAGGTTFSWRDGITRNLWGSRLPSAQAPWGVPLNWGAPILVRDTVCLGFPNPLCGAQSSGLGSGAPDWRFSVSTSAQWRRLSVFLMLDGAIGRDVWNVQRQWRYLELNSVDGDQAGRSVETAKPVGYYWRAGPPDGFVGYGGLYDLLAPNSYFVESASYAKLRELALSYELGPVLGLGRWSLGIIGRNLLTISGYSGLDPEASEHIAVDMAQLPTLRTLTASLAVRF